MYVGFVVVLATALSQGLRGDRAARIRRAVGASRRTLQRWRCWWREAFVDLPCWRAGKARFAPAVDESLLPRSLVDLRVLMTIGAELLSHAAKDEVTQLDEKLFLKVFSTPRSEQPRPANKARPKAGER